MQPAAILLILAGIALAAFIGFPLRTRLANRLGQDDFQNKLQDARKAGDPLAKRLFLVGWVSGALVVFGAVILLFTEFL
jgi:hypothetical protein